MRKPLAVAILSLLVILSVLSLSAITTGAVDPSRIQPLLIVERVNTEKAVAGSYFYVTLVIKNYSEHPAFNVQARVSTQGTKEQVFTRVREATDENPDLEKIEGQQTRSLTFAVNTSAEAQSKDYTLLITLESQNALFQPAPQSSASITVPVVFELTRPNITVSSVVLDPKTPSVQEPFTAVFYLDNYSNAEARNVTVEITGQDNFQVADFTNRKFLQSISRGAGNFVVFKLQGLEGRSSNSVRLKFTYDYAGQAQVSQELLVNLPLGYLEPGSSPFLKVSSFSLQGTSRSGEHLFRLTLENIGQEAALDINISLEGSGNIYVLHASNVDYITRVEGKTKVTREYTLGINPSQGTAHYPLKVSLKYSDRSGKSHTSAETLGISSAALDPGPAAAGKPRVLISKYTLSDEKILAGNIVNLALFIENTHARPVQNIKVSFGVIQVEGSSGGTVFSPVNSSNSFFIPQIPGRTTFEKSVDFLVDPNATAKTYIVPVTIEYEDEGAASYSVSEMVNIPVTQECKLQVLSLEIPPTAYVGQPVFVGAEFVNVGKAALNNFIVMLDGDFRKEQASYYVGNLQIGASDFYQGIIYPENEGSLSGKLIFSYMDNNNREVRVEEPFELNVQAMGGMEPFPGENFPEQRDPGYPGGPVSRGKGLLIYIIPPVVLALSVGIYLWRRKIKKDNEEFLDA